MARRSSSKPSKTREVFLKITDIRVQIAEIRNEYGRGQLPDFPLGVLSIETDEGIVGHDFMSLPGIGPRQTGEQILNFVRPRLLGRNPLDIGAIWNQLARLGRNIDPSVQGYIDVALWDIAGKAAGLPIHRLLGSVRTRVPAYASGWFHAAVDDYIDEALAFGEMGLKAYKIHPPSFARAFGQKVESMDTDLAISRAVRKAVGESVPLFLDPVIGYGYEDAIRIGRGIQDLDFVWYEDPLPSYDLHGYVRLKSHLHIPILATETLVGGLHALAPWITSGATDYLRGDVVIKGGITGLMKIAHLAEGFGMNCEIHDAYNSLNNVASLHVAAAVNNCHWFEILIVDPPGKHTFDHLNMCLADPFVIERDGHVVVPEAAGLGVEIDWDRLKSAGLRALS
jgi:L-alanine-DL-glutamate epimerase-like enolase superfamily enzyme